MDDFFGNLAKFFGGIAGDQNTNAGLSIHDVSSGDREIFGDSPIAVPFTYRDTKAHDNQTKNGTYRSGFLLVPSYSRYDITDKNLIDNRGTVSVLGAELDDGTKLNYNQTLNFLNSLNKDNDFKVSRHSLGNNSSLWYDEENDNYYPMSGYSNALSEVFDRGRAYPKIDYLTKEERNNFTDNLRKVLSVMNKENQFAKTSIYEQGAPEIWRSLRGEDSSYGHKLDNAYDFIKNYRGL